MPRPAKPIEQKRREGNPGGRALPEPLAVVPALDAVPSPPEGLGAAGRAFWSDVFSVGLAFMSPQLDAALVEQAAGHFDECARYREMLAKAPLLRQPITSSSGAVVGERFVPNPLEGMLRRVEKQLLAELVLLAIPPAARARLGLIQVRAASELQELAERQARTVELDYDDGKTIDAEVVDG